LSPGFWGINRFFLSVSETAYRVVFVGEGEGQESVYCCLFLATTTVFETEKISIPSSSFQVGWNTILFTSDAFSKYVEVKMSEIEIGYKTITTFFLLGIY